MHDDVGAGMGYNKGSTNGRMEFLRLTAQFNLEQIGLVCSRPRIRLADFSIFPP